MTDDQNNLDPDEAWLEQQPDVGATPFDDVLDTDDLYDLWKDHTMSTDKQRSRQNLVDAINEMRKWLDDLETSLESEDKSP